jgi:hypothetical protein
MTVLPQEWVVMDDHEVSAADALDEAAKTAAFRREAADILSRSRWYAEDLLHRKREGSPRSRASLATIDTSADSGTRSSPRTCNGDGGRAAAALVVLLLLGIAARLVVIRRRRNLNLAAQDTNPRGPGLVTTVTGAVDGLQEGGPGLGQEGHRRQGGHRRVGPRSPLRGAPAAELCRHVSRGQRVARIGPKSGRAFQREGATFAPSVCSPGWPETGPAAKERRSLRMRRGMRCPAHASHARSPSPAPPPCWRSAAPPGRRN